MHGESLLEIEKSKILTIFPYVNQLKGKRYQMFIRNIIKDEELIYILSK